MAYETQRFTAALTSGSVSTLGEEGVFDQYFEFVLFLYLTFLVTLPVNKIRKYWE